MVNVTVNSGEYVILTPLDELTRQLKQIERAGRTCYRSVEQGGSKKFLRMLIKLGHESVLEHSSLVVRFKNCSRGFTHEMVRHRLASYSQESTRYVDQSNLEFVLPPSLDSSNHIEIDLADTGINILTAEDGMRNNMTVKAMVSVYEAFYRSLLKTGVPLEDARQFLPIGTTSEIVVGANFREWRHIMYMRTSKHAHWEIRSVMTRLLNYLRAHVPPVFDDFVYSGVCKYNIPHYEKRS